MITAKVDDTAVDGLTKGYKKQVELYRSMLEITQMQSEGLSRRGDIREFVSLLQKKEDIIRSIDKLESGLVPLKRAWKNTPKEDKEQLSARAGKLNSLLDKVIVLIEKVIRQERANEKTLQKRRDQFGEDLALINRGRRMHKAFASKPKPRFIDAKS